MRPLISQRWSRPLWSISERVVDACWRRIRAAAARGSGRNAGCKWDSVCVI